MPLGFAADRVLIVNVNTTHANIAPANRVPLFMRLIQAIAAIPGVSGVGGSTLTPIGGIAVVSFVNVFGTPPMAESARAVACNVITPGWLAAYGMRFRSGRDFDVHDMKNSQPVAIVNDAFAQRFFPGRNVIGGTFAGGDGPTLTIVGVVSDAVYNSARDPIPPTIYQPLTQNSTPPSTLAISVRLRSGTPSLLTGPIATAVINVDPDLAFSFRPLAEQVGASITQDRLLAMLSAFFGALALILAGLGLNGMASYAVARRRTEIGVRMALGAGPGRVVRLVLTRVSMLIAAGLIVGAIASVWASTVVASLLYGLEPRDPPTLVGATITLLAVGALAAWLPAYRASRLDPADVLRES
jgi:putative ABC transport system permease protein